MHLPLYRETCNLVSAVVDRWGVVMEASNHVSAVVNRLGVSMEAMVIRAVSCRLEDAQGKLLGSSLSGCRSPPTPCCLSRQFVLDAYILQFVLDAYIQAFCLRSVYFLTDNVNCTPSHNLGVKNTFSIITSCEYRVLT